jgi:hypothetical protein
MTRFNGALTAANGRGSLRYAWDFGDDTVVAHGTAVEEHAYAKPGWYVAKLAVVSTDGTTSGYEQVVQVGKPAGSKPASNACGLVPPRQLAALLGGTAAEPARTRIGGGGGPAPRSPLLPLAGAAGVAAAAAVTVRRRTRPAVQPVAVG